MVVNLSIEYKVIDEALAAWGIVLKERKWPMWSDFEQFLKEEDKKSVSRDAWQQLYHFMKTYPKDLSEYDPMCKKFSTWFDLFYQPRGQLSLMSL